MQNSAVPCHESISPWNLAKALTFCAFPIIPLLAPLGYYLGAPWLSPAIILIGIPLVDLMMPADRSGDGIGTSRALVAVLRVVPMIYFVTWTGTLAWSLYTIRDQTLAWSTEAWLLLSVAVGSAFATCAAHEMLHWPERLPRAAARLIMAAVAYGPFPIEHRHHHAAVGLPPEGTAPPLGQGLWNYIVANVAHTYTNAWLIARERQLRTHRNLLWNVFVQQVALTALVIACFFAIGGAAGLLLFAVQALQGIYTTEYVNYAQHYGLRRSACDSITGAVSWSSNGFATNALTLNITRHADHHVNGSRRYYELRHIPNTPTLPAGYFALLVPAMIPAVWRALMDVRAKDASANIGTDQVSSTP